MSHQPHRTVRLPSDGVQAPASAPARCDIQKREAERDRQLAAVLNRQGSARRVYPEICKRHLAARDQRGPGCEQAHTNQRPQDRLNDCCRSNQRHERYPMTAKRADELLQPVAPVQKCKDDAHGAVGQLVAWLKQAFQHWWIRASRDSLTIPTIRLSTIRLSDYAVPVPWTGWYQFRRPSRNRVL